VEQGLFQSLSGCSSVAGETTSLDAMRAAIMDAPLVSCDQPTAVFFGLSLAAWHALMSSGAAIVYMLWQWRQARG
jgi:disulfide bond formation protein DsbB